MASTIPVQVSTFPVAANVICLWTVTPPGYHNVNIVPQGTRSKLLLTRRLIVAGRRINLFLYEIETFRDGAPCVASFEGSSGQRFVQRAARVADWRAAGAANVVRQVVTALPELGELRLDTQLLERYLGLVSAWRAPCLFSGRVGSLNASAFAVAGARSGHRLSLLGFGFGDGAPRVVSAEIVSLADQMCLLWRGDAFETAYVDLDGDLVELATATAAARTGEEDFVRWLRGRGAEERSAVLEGLAAIPLAAGDDDFAALAGGIDRTARLHRHDSHPLIHGVVAVSGVLWLFAEFDGDELDDPPLAVLGKVGEPVQEFRPYRRLSLSTGENDRRQLLIYRTAVNDNGADSSPIRISLTREGSVASAWIAPSRQRDIHARRLMRDIIPWHRADRAMIRDLYVPILGAQPSGDLVRPVELAARRDLPSERDPLVLCFSDGDLAALRLSLVAVSLTTRGSTATVRVILRNLGGTPLEAAVGGMARQYGFACEVIAVRTDEPVDAALAMSDEDRRFGGVVLLPAGAVPGLPDWWSRLLPALRRNPGAVFASSKAAEGEPPILASTVEARPVVLGPGVEMAGVLPRLRLTTFEGVAASIIAGAQLQGILRPDAALDFHLPDGNSYGTVEPPAGRLRLDDSVLEHALATGQTATGSAIGARKVSRLPRREPRLVRTEV